MKILERKLFKELIKWVPRREILAIKGPRQSGKTTLLQMLQQWLIEEQQVPSEHIIFLTFEDRELLESFRHNPKQFILRYAFDHKQQYYVFIDEAQYCQEIGQNLKLLYDAYTHIKFIITGSSSLELVNHTGKYLVGRMFSFELLPFSFGEFLLSQDEGLASLYHEQNKKIREYLSFGHSLSIPKNDISTQQLFPLFEQYLLYGGYPEVIKASRDEERIIVLKNIYNTYIEKDILAFLQITDIVKFRKLVSLLSFILGGLLSYEKLTNECKTYYKDIVYLLDVLEQTYIIKRVRPFHQNLVTELRKNPKLYFYDLGLRNYAIQAFNAIHLRDDIGRLAENFVLSQLAEDNLNIFFWRTTLKAEVDFVLELGQTFLPVEVKFEAMPKPRLTRSFHSFLNHYQPERALIVTKDVWGKQYIGKTEVLFVPIVHM